jgi:hypothetical protein
VLAPLPSRERATRALRERGEGADPASLPLVHRSLGEGGKTTKAPERSGAFLSWVNKASDAA